MARLKASAATGIIEDTLVSVKAPSVAPTSLSTLLNLGFDRIITPVPANTRVNVHQMVAADVQASDASKLRVALATLEASAPKTPRVDAPASLWVTYAGAAAEYAKSKETLQAKIAIANGETVTEYPFTVRYTAAPTSKLMDGGEYVTTATAVDTSDTSNLTARCGSFLLRDDKGKIVFLRRKLDDAVYVAITVEQSRVDHTVLANLVRVAIVTRYQRMAALDNARNASTRHEAGTAIAAQAANDAAMIKLVTQQAAMDAAA